METQTDLKIANKVVHSSNLLLNSPYQKYGEVMKYYTFVYDLATNDSLHYYQIDHPYLDYFLGISTGVRFYYSGYNFFEVEISSDVEHVMWRDFGLNFFGQKMYVRQDLVNLSTPDGDTINATAQDAESLLRDIIYYNQEIYTDCYVSAYLIKKIETGGKTVPDNIKKGIIQLLQNMAARDNYIRDNDRIEIKTVGETRMTEPYQNALNELYNAGIGLVTTFSITTAAIIAAIAIAAVIALVLWLKPSRKQAKKDYETSKSFQRTLKSLSPEDAAIVEKEIQDAYQAGYRLGVDEGSSSKLKTFGMLAAGLGIFFIAKPLVRTLGLNEGRE